jgi:ATP-dependent Lon protease
VNAGDYVKDFPADIAEGIKKAAETTRLEYFLKERLSPYLVKAVQKVLLDENADPKTELQKAQDQAQKEVVDKYNADLKK